MSDVNLSSVFSADVGELLNMGDDGDMLLMLVWVLPIFILIFYGQRIQLYVTAGEIKKSIKKLSRYSDEARAALRDCVARSGTVPQERLDEMTDYFTILPVDMDPNGIMPKIQHIIRTREEYTRRDVQALLPGLEGPEIDRVQTILEIAATQRLLHKTINHLLLTAKKQKNYPLILPLQMMLPLLMEQASALNDSLPVFAANQPIGDGIGPMVVSSMMGNLDRSTVAFQTISAEADMDGRRVILVKAAGPSPTVGRLDEALDRVLSDNRIDCIISVDAALRLEGESSATVSQGFGTAMGGIGTERFRIEAAAVKSGIPTFAVIIRQSIREAVTLMTGDIARSAGAAESRVRSIISQNTAPGDTVLVLGVGNTMGVM